MKFTNVKQLIIKFMGGGLINFPTRFLRWVKINGDVDNDGGGDSADINTILDNISIKDDLLSKLQAIDYTNQDENGVLTNLTFDDVFNDYNDFIKSVLYRERLPTIAVIVFFEYDNTIQLVNLDGLLRFETPVENNIFYQVNIIKENNDIKIYVARIENVS